MSALFAYSLYSGLFLLAGYLAYRALLASEKQPALNRAALLGVYAVALLACPSAPYSPLCVPQMPRPQPASHSTSVL